MMDRPNRRPRDVVGDDPVLLHCWDDLPDQVKRQLLDSTYTVSTLGELQLLAQQLEHLSDEPPAVF